MSNKLNGLSSRQATMLYTGLILYQNEAREMSVTLSESDKENIW